MEKSYNRALYRGDKIILVVVTFGVRKFDNAFFSFVLMLERILTFTIEVFLP